MRKRRVSPRHFRWLASDSVSTSAFAVGHAPKGCQAALGADGDLLLLVPQQLLVLEVAEELDHVLAHLGELVDHAAQLRRRWLAARLGTAVRLVLRVLVRRR